MMDSYSIRVSGSEVARVSAEQIECCKRLDAPELTGGKLVDDPKMLRIMQDGKAVAVFYVSSADNISVEKVSE